MKKYVIAFIVASLTSLATAYAASCLAPSLSHEDFWKLTLGCFAKDIALWLKNHPVDIDKIVLWMLAPILAIGLLTGCALTKTDQSAQADGTSRTKTFVLSVWDAKGVLKDFKATQSQKTQSTTLGSSSAESASPTNVLKIIVEGAKGL